MKDLNDFTDEELDSIINEFNISSLIDSIDNKLKIEKDPIIIEKLEKRLAELIIIQKR